MAFVLPFLAPGLGAAFVEGVLAALGITLVVGVATDPKVKESAKDAAAKVTQWLSSRREGRMGNTVEDKEILCYTV